MTITTVNVDGFKACLVSLTRVLSQSVCEVYRWNNSESRSTLSKVMDESLTACFWLTL